MRWRRSRRPKSSSTRPQAAPPRASILDIHLNGMSGIELHERLVSPGRAIPVIFITAHDDAPTRERIDRSGAAAFLAKPFDRQALIGAIRGALETT